MSSTWIDFAPLWLLFPATVAIVLVAIEIGYRFGKIRREQSPDEKEGPVGAMSAAALGLLAFFLAITFGYVGNRFDDRRTALIDEVNAIGTCFLRSQTLPSGLSSQVQSLLRDYVRNRIEGTNLEDVTTAIRLAEEMQSKLWAIAMKSVEQDRSPVAALFVSSLNDVIDLHAKRVAYALHSRLPGVIWFALVLVTVLSMLVLGYLQGLSRSTRSPAIIPLVLMFATVLTLIADLDRPGEGTLQLGPGMMKDLERQMKMETTSP